MLNAPTCLFLLVSFALGLAQSAAAQGKQHSFWAEGYAFVGRRTSTPGTSVGGAGGDVFVFKGLAAGGDLSTTISNPDDRITVGSIGASYHFLCCRPERKIEPFAGAGYSYLWGNVNTHGIYYPADPGQERSGPYFSEGLIVWPMKHLGARFELREERFYVSYGALQNVVPGGHFVEFRIAVTLR